MVHWLYFTHYNLEICSSSPDSRLEPKSGHENLYKDTVADMSELLRNPADAHGTNSATVRTAAKLRGLIAEQQIKPEQLARNLNISRPTLRRWLSGHQDLDLNTIEALADQLHVSPAALWVDHHNDRIETAA